MNTIKDKIFKASRETYGTNVVKYGYSELKVFNPYFSEIRYGFDWGDTEEGSQLLASAMLNEVGSSEISRIYARRYAEEVISRIIDDDWSLSAIEVALWINKNTMHKVHIKELEAISKTDDIDKEKEIRKIQREKDFAKMANKRVEEKEKEKEKAKKEKEEKQEKAKREKEEKEEKAKQEKEEKVKREKEEKVKQVKEEKAKREKEEKAKQEKEEKQKQEKEDNMQKEIEELNYEDTGNIINDLCEKVGITQATLADLLNVNNQTVKNWRLENEMPKLAKRAMDFYYEMQKNEKNSSTNEEVLNSLEENISLQENTIKKYEEQSKIQSKKIELIEKELITYKDFLKQLDVPSLYKKFTQEK